MKVQGVNCLKCGDFIFSRARHDFHYCTCKSVAIDGGFEYMKVCGNLEDFQSQEREIFASKKDLYDDWNKGTDKLGVIPKETIISQ